MGNELTSNYLYNRYTKNSRDDFVFEVNGGVGLQIVRKYKSKKIPENYRMFIKLYFKKVGDKWHVEGGVDTVENTEDHSQGWRLIFNEKSYFQKPTNYYFGSNENITFNPNNNTIILKNKEHTITGFVDILEKNHMRDMFLFARTKQFSVLCVLHILFFLVDSRFDLSKHLWKNRESEFKAEEQQKEIIDSPDPLFHTFDIYRNLLGVFLLFILYPIYLASAILDNNYFSISNPFLIVVGLLLLYILEKVSIGLHDLTSSDIITRISRNIVELKGDIKN
jgi:hypothetical protein